MAPEEPSTAAGTLVATVGPNEERPQIAKLVKERTGREVVIGDIGLKIFPKIGAHLRRA